MCGLRKQPLQGWHSPNSKSRRLMTFRSQKGAQCRHAATTSLGGRGGPDSWHLWPRTFGLNIFHLKAFAPARSLPDSQRCQNCAKSPQLDCRGCWPVCLWLPRLHPGESAFFRSKLRRRQALGKCASARGGFRWRKGTAANLCQPTSPARTAFTVGAAEQRARMLRRWPG